MNGATFKSNIRSFGVSKAVADVAIRAVNRVLLLKVIKGIRIETVDPAFLECDGKYSGMFLDAAKLWHFAAEPKNELRPDFLDKALAKGDECYGFLAGPALAAYGWYSSKPTALDLLGLRLRFSDQYVYMYKGFTAADHRGHRLHAIGMTRALEAYLARGYRGIVSCVEWNNYASLNSCYRMGYHDFGSIAIAGLGKRYILHHDNGCREYGFRLERTGESDEHCIASRMAQMQ